MTEKPAPPTLLLCNCQGTMEIDGARLARALGREAALPVHRELCRSQTTAYEAALRADGDVVVACRQEAPLFREIAGEVATGTDADGRLDFVDIRDRAGWCARKPDALPKMAALIAEARHVAKPTGLTTLRSEGICLVYGAGQPALDAAQRLSGRLSVSLILTDATDTLPPAVADIAVARGRIRRLSGHLGAFEVEVDDYAPALPSSRAAFEFAMARNGAKSTCNLVVDLSGGRPLINDHRRDGYLRADPNDRAAVAELLFTASDLVGEFEKPIYVAYDAAICAHARSGKIGCSKCLDVCPTGAITPAGDHVAIATAICGGCGNCSAVCPTGAVSYALPPRADVVARVEIVLETYLRAGGTRPILLVHDEGHGAPLISAIARAGRGLPANVIPLALNSSLLLGHDLMLAMLASGAGQIVVLAPPEHPEELAALESQAALAMAFLDGLGYAGPRIRVVVEHDPDSVETTLHELPALPQIERRPIPGLGTKRDLARTALSRLHEQAPTPQSYIDLPKGAPYGRMVVATDGCTLCLSCVGACPTGAITDHPERPELAFTQAACVQCGLCVATCPERVVTLAPGYDFTTAALSPAVIKTEEPFACVRCAKPFGAKSSIERVVARLEGHSMFRNPEQIRLIQMCEDCRVVTLAERGDDPFRGGERPRMRTTDDDLKAAEQAKKTGRKPEDFLS